MKQAEPATLDVSREAEVKLRDYLSLLRTWNARINLVANAPEEQLWQRHVLDSWQLLPLLPDGPLADLGSGGGLPGLVIAIGRQQETHLVESDRRKCAFLIEASRALDLSHVCVHPMRIDDAKLPPVRVVTARALAPLKSLLPQAARILGPDGVALFPKGRSVDAELTEAAPHWFMRVERFQSRTDAQSTILRLSEIRPAGA
ncbi:16S rRNA (guanine(527)-N(7))-methyltransferase RsmG [Roseococcus sp. SYP-B2431]|uniref:16S rRNA (guanine(527)-N(7))-methyltransferase RsmG n=1 Tax=Roseococcus sp. SYP-B2431 TaxID=2496640 RepID=UPI0013F42A29|nr:16S rRNA (guanine(527)-N(7))-methyltransferase RsmG [Roseococcus sp. SYP-B2431]